MEWLSLSGDLTRDRAVEQILAPSTSTDANSELCLHLGDVERLDVVTAAAVRLRVVRHEREHPQGTVSLVLPSEPGIAARLAALLDPLPDRIKLTGERHAEPPANYALVPATVVGDSHSAVALGAWTLDACERVGIPEQRTAFIAAAVMELADNAVIHAEGPSDPPVAAATSTRDVRVVEIAVLDTGRAIAESDAPRELLRTITRRALDGEPGFLGQILERARKAQVQVHVQMFAGTARLLWTSMQHRTAEGRFLPGTTVVVRVAEERPVVRSSSSARNT